MKGEKQVVFKDKMIKEGKRGLVKNVNKMWNEMASYIKRVAKEVFLENLKDVSNKLRRLDG